MAPLKKAHKRLLLLASFIFISVSVTPTTIQTITDLQAQIETLKETLKIEKASVTSLQTQLQQQQDSAPDSTQLYKRPGAQPRQYRRRITTTQPTRGRYQQRGRGAIQPRGRR